MNVLVTGGGGFLGRHLAQRLLDRGDSVWALGRGTYDYLDQKINQIQADIRNRDAVFQACANMDVVFHTAALPGIWGDRDTIWGINTHGTQNVVDACLEHAVKKLVFTSSPSVVFDQTNMENVNEDTPYPSRYLCDYPESKAEAERIVLRANGKNGLLTVSLRPHLIWGPGDPHLVPRILQKAKAGRLAQVGNGLNRVDIIYVDNAVEAHVLACDALSEGSPLAGQCYFVSDSEPVNLWDWINGLLVRLGQKPVTRKLSYKSAYALGSVLEFVYRLLNLKGEPPMTRFLAGTLAKSHYFDCSRAKRDFNYQPIVNPDEGMSRLIQSLQARPSD